MGLSLNLLNQLENRINVIVTENEHLRTLCQQMETEKAQLEKERGDVLAVVNRLIAKLDSLEG